LTFLDIVGKEPKKTGHKSASPGEIQIFSSWEDSGLTEKSVVYNAGRNCAQKPNPNFLFALFFFFLKLQLILKTNQHTGKGDAVPTTQLPGQSLPRAAHPCKCHPAPQLRDPPGFSST